MKKYILNSFIAVTLLFAASCKPEIDTPAGTSAGTANFSKYIAVGNSLTSGFADGGLYLEGQMVAYPNLMAEKMASVGGGSFTSPFFTEAQANGSGYASLTALVNGTPTIGKVTNNLAFRDAAGHLTKYTTEVQNLGVPGMRVDLAFAGQFSALNPYFERLLPDAQVGNTTYFQFVQGRNHTFFSLWLGNNDALGNALNGGVTVLTDPTTVLTDKASFALLYSNLINFLTANGQKGVVGTIPDVTAVPYFNTVTVSALLGAAKAINPAATAVYIQTGTGAVRAATNEDLIRLPFQNEGLFGVPTGGIPYGLHPLNPITNNWVLDKDEVAKIKDYVNSYNSTIKSLATSKGLAIADTYAYFNQVKTGVMIQGVGINSAFITGGAFSLDGIHLTPRGNAVIANVFIDAINATYASTVPNIDITQYRGVKFPN